MIQEWAITRILASLTLIFFKIFYRICESACRKFCNFFVPKKDLHDEIVLITGAGHGMGRELALQYAHLGATVVCLDINQQMNENTLNEIIKTTGKQAYAYQCDVTDRARVFKIAEDVKREIGDVTILINNVGIMSCHKFLSLTADHIRSQFDVNVLSQFWTLQAFLPNMIEKNYGHIVSISSITGLMGMPYLTAYSATKYAIRGFMTALEEELRLSSNNKSLIKFTTVFPFMVDTGLCKKPKIKYPKFTPLTPTKDAAAEIINAQRREIVEKSIPSFWQPFLHWALTLPKKAQVDLRDFIDSYIEPDS